MRLLSREFLYFFLIVFSFCWLLPRKFRNFFLVISSYAFYLSWNWRYGFLLAMVTALSFFCGLIVQKTKRQTARRWVIFSVFAHLIILVFFKYNQTQLAYFDILGMEKVDAWVYPLGLSYYVFQSLGYVLDVYRGYSPNANLINYALFLSFFPQITAGPIARANNFFPQIQSPPSFDWQRLREGLHLVFWGFFLKIFIADNLRVLVKGAFDGQIDSGGMALLGIYAFAIQLYCDFSGYTDIARGLAKCLGIDLGINFKWPFFSSDMREFWKRWHISLSGWFTYFLYRPILDIPRLPYKLYTAPLFTMIIMGLWHGMTGPMLLMGFYYGVVMVITLYVKAKIRIDASPQGISLWAQRLLTFHLACAGLLLLRVNNLEQAGSFFGQMLGNFSWPPQAWATARLLLFYASPLVLIESLQYKKGDSLVVLRMHPILQFCFYAVLSILILIFGNFSSEEFFYRSF